MKIPDLKEVGSTAGKFGAATVGLVAGSRVANMIGGLTMPATVPVAIAEHLKKAAPGVLLMIAAYFASAKFKSKSEFVEPAAVGLGLAGFANLLKAYFPEIAKDYLPSLQGMEDMEDMENMGLYQQSGQLEDERMLQLNGPMDIENPSMLLMLRS